LGGARVTLTLLSTGRSDKVVAKPDGAFSVGLVHAPFLCGELRLDVGAQGYVDYHESLPCKTNRTQDVVLTAQGEARAPESRAR
jgi:hypothetical protein